ncbi:tyrosine-type recombinase/integrase [Devosia sp.]|uniref:tyrosine-type recombinase/integrase n=1 Tax=Devosia sp. TaxID=1871048 RepID=UPI00326590FD
MPTVAKLCDTYLLEGVGLKKPSTLATDRGRIEQHIKPLLGSKKVADVTQADVRKFLRSVADGATAKVSKTKPRGKAVVRGGRGTATRTVGLLGGIFSYAQELGLISSNPVHGVPRFPDNKNERFLSMEEISTLGAALRKAESKGVNEKALTIIELLLLTGARRGEIEALKWSEFDAAGQRLRLSDSKTGQKNIPLSSAASALLSKCRQQAKSDATYVFPATTGNGYYLGTPRVWSALRETIGMRDTRIHDLRHSFASVGAVSGTPLLVLGAILGHSDHGTTQRYAHIAANPISSATEVISNLIAEAMARPNPSRDS